MGFEFYTASKIVFERGSIKKLPMLCKDLGRHFLIVAGGASMQKSGVLEALANGLKKEGIRHTLHTGIVAEPTPEIVDETVRAGKNAGVDAVIGIGGGSVMDTAKAAAGVITNGGSVRDYLEGVGIGKEIETAPLPFVAIPTTAGTGTEVTKNAVIMSQQEGYKKSIRHEMLIADLALLDPELTLSVPQSVTAASGMDAICQLIESYTAKQANAFCDAMSLYHTPLAMQALKKAYDDGEDIEARETMALASLVSGMCLANAGLGAAHGIGAGLGAVLGVHHGIACGMLLPHVMRYNIDNGITKYAELGRTFCKKQFADDRQASLAAADTVFELCEYLGLPNGLRELGVTQDMINTIAQASMGSSMRKNPVDISKDECADFIKSII